MTYYSTVLGVAIASSSTTNIMRNITNKNVSTTEIITTMRTATFTIAMTSVAHLALRGDP